MIFKDPKDMSDMEMHMWLLTGVVAMFVVALLFLARCR
jgi:hypothetical protein